AAEAGDATAPPASLTLPRMMWIASFDPFRRGRGGRGGSFVADRYRLPNALPSLSDKPTRNSVVDGRVLGETLKNPDGRWRISPIASSVLPSGRMRPPP